MKKLDVKIGQSIYSLEPHDANKVILTKRHESEEIGTTMVINKYALRTLARWVFLQEECDALEGSHKL